MIGKRVLVAYAAVAGLLLSGVAFAAPAGAAVPANDNYANRITIAPDQTVSFSNLGATFEPSIDFPAVQAACLQTEPFPPEFQVPSIWYDFTPTVSGRMKVVFSDADFIPVDVVVSGNPGSFVGLSCFGTTFDVVAGTTYHLAVADLVGGPGGTGNFVVATAPPPPTATVTVDGTGTVDRAANTVAIGGTVVCTGAAFADLFGQVRQVTGRFFINGFFSADLTPCDGNRHKWSGTVAFGTGQFGRGTATVFSSPSICNDFDSAAVTVPDTQVKLKSIRGTEPTPPPPPDASFSVTVDPTGTLDRATNTATIGGTVNCTGDGTAVLQGGLRQTSRRIFVDGFAFGEIGTCDGTTQRWSISVIGSTGLFASGRATLTNAFAGSCDDEFNCTGGAVGGTVQLRATGKRPPFGAPPPGPGSPTLVVNVDRTAQLDTATNTATISGTETCTEGNFGPSLNLFVRQRVGRIFIDGSNGLFGEPCDGVPHAWSMPVTGQTGRFAKGLAVVTGDLSVCGDVECASTPISANVWLVQPRHHWKGH